MNQIGQTLSEVINFIDAKDKQDLSLNKYQELRNILLVKLQEINDKEYEEIASLHYYLLILGLQFNQIKLDEIDRLYIMLQNYFEKEEDKIKGQIKKTKKKQVKPLHFQLAYFYKTFEYYYSNLENLFRERLFFDHAKKAYADKLKILASQRFSEHKFIDYFEYKRAELTNRFRSHYLLYTFIGGIGMIVFWRGIWDLTYIIPIIQNPIGSILLGLILMAITGFIASIGDRSIISTQDKFEE
ncbi:hypothetical protein A2335_01295 [Candidatus Peregrinibacteria bacterium RIFOXYB2_FULL_32_7]|nr:MAG: hypothetical protein A2335_01295 [Candidatus Peregrinibacteria bacterium RIFOXYB2_FULL_32_7]